MLRLLWASPLPPVRSGVSDYAAELLPALARLAHLRVATPPEVKAPAEVGAALGVEMVPSDAAPLPGELTLVHLGNNPYHRWLLPLLTRPGVVAVMHDLVLHHLLVETTLAVGDRPGYERALAAAHGDDGRALADARRWGVTGPRDPFLLPARKAFLAGVTAVVAHSRWAADLVRRELPEVPVGLMPLPVRDPGPVDRVAERDRLGVGPDELLLMHLGFLTPAKGLAEILAAVATVRRMGVPVHLVLVGEGRLPEAVAGRAAEVGLDGHVTATGWVDGETMVRFPGAADLGVVVRTPSAGETSAAVLRFLAAGTPVAVSGLHQFLEWPEEAALRVTPGPAATADLSRVLRTVWGERGSASAARRRVAARAAWEDGHRPAEAAEQLVAFLAGVAGEPS